MNKGYYWSLHSMHFCNCLILQADQVHFYSFPVRNFYCVVHGSKKDKEKMKHDIIFPTPCTLLPPPLTALLTPCLITHPCRTHSPNLKFLLVNGFLIHCSPLSFFYKDRNNPIRLFFFRKRILTSSWITHECLNLVLWFLWERRRRNKVLKMPRYFCLQIRRMYDKKALKKRVGVRRKFEVV